MSIPEFVYTVLLKPRPLRKLANAAIRAWLPSTVNVGNAVIWINPNDPVVSGGLALGVFEREEIAFFRAHFRPEMTFIDVGANVGLYTGMALATKASRVLAIEPHGESRQYLQKTILANGGTNVTVAAVAASDFTGTLKLYKNSENKGDNRIYPDPLLGESESIAADTIDNICERHGIHSIQFLKIDIQGAEAKAIAGASNLLNNSADCILMTEFWPYGIRHSDGNPGNYLESLKRHGFTLYELYKNRILPMDSPESLVSRNPGRKYTNLIGLKGRFTDIISL